MCRRVRGRDGFGRVRANSGRARSPGARRTRRGRRINASRAARLLSEMFQLGLALETAMRRPSRPPRLWPIEEISFDGRDIRAELNKMGITG